MSKALHTLCLTSILLLIWIPLACHKTPPLEERLLQLFRDEHLDKLQDLMKDNPDEARQVLFRRMDLWIHQSQQGRQDEAVRDLQETRRLAAVFKKATGEDYPALFERYLFQLLRDGRRSDLEALMRQNPEGMRPILHQRLEARTNLERQGQGRQAEAVLLETMTMARAYEELAHTGFYEWIRRLAGASFEDRSVLQPKIKQLVNESWKKLRQREFGQALLLIDQVEAVHRALQDPYTQFNIHYLRGRTLIHQRRYSEAQQELHTARRLGLELDYRRGVPLVDVELAVMEAVEGHLMDALKLYRRSLDDQRRMLLLLDAVSTLTRLGALYTRLGNPYEGLAAYQEALKIQDQVQDDWNRPEVLNNIAMIYADRDDFSQALEIYRRALDGAQAVKRGEVTGLVLNNLGELYYKNGQKEKALEFLRQALQVKRTSRSPADAIAYTLRALGEVCLSLRQWDEARRYLSDARAEALRLGPGAYHAILRATIYSLQGRLFREQNLFPQAAAALRQSIQELESQLAALTVQEWKAGLLAVIQDIYHEMQNCSEQ